jgi:hypothetical protein
VAVAGCEQETVVIDTDDIQQNGNNISEIEFQKNDFSVIIVAFDIITILILIWFAYFLEEKQKEFVENFEDETIQMTDFCVRF